MKNEFKYIKPWENIRKYSVKHSVEIKENGVLKNSEVRFNLTIKCIATINPTIFSLKVERENFLLNGKSPDEPHMQMFIGAENCLFPISIEISDQGKFSGIHDFYDWKNNALNRLEKLKSEFEGFYADDFIRRFQEEIQTESSLKIKLKGQAVFNTLFYHPYEEKSKESIEWNLLKIGTNTFEGMVTTKNLEEKLIETQFESKHSINTLTLPRKETEEFDSKIHFTHQFNPFSGLTQKKECDVTLNTKDNKFSYQEKISMNYIGARNEKTNPIKEVKQKSFFLSEKQEIIK